MNAEGDGADHSPDRDGDDDGGVRTNVEDLDLGEDDDSDDERDAEEAA